MLKAPWTPKRVPGEVVAPTPTLPEAATMRPTAFDAVETTEPGVGPLAETERLAQGVVEEMPTLPSLRMVKSEGEEVAVPATVVVAKYKLPPALRKAHWATPAPADNASWDAVAELGFRSQVGVVVPMPTLPLLFQMPKPGKYAVPETVSAVVEALEDIRPYPRAVIAVASVRAYTLAVLPSSSCAPQNSKSLVPL